MTHQKTAGHAPALGVMRPAFHIDTTGQVTLEPCTHCGTMAVCRPVMGRQGIRTYPYCVEKCWPVAFNGSQQTTNNRAVCDCCGEYTVVRRVRLATGLTDLHYCHACTAPALTGMTRVPVCIHCGDSLQPHQYDRGVCSECW